MRQQPLTILEQNKVLHCKYCGLTVSDPLTLRCPRCWHQLVKTEACDGDCRRCHKEVGCRRSEV